MKNTSIFKRLVTSYFIFSLLTIVALFVAILVGFLGVSEGNPQSFMPDTVVNEDGSVSSIEAIENMGGWLEKLDSNYKVVEVFGNKQTDTMQYSNEEIFSLLQTRQDAESKYLGLIMSKELDEGVFHYLVQYSRSDVSVTYSFLLNSTNVSSIWTFIPLVVFLLIYIISLIGMSYYLSRTIRKPLGQLTIGMERVKNGEESVKLDFKTHAEFTEIKDAFNIMSDRIQKQKDERNRMMLELSHDIKTPISTIKTYANALEEGLVAEDQIQTYYKVIDTKADRVTALTDDMFTMLKMEMPDYVLAKEETDINELIREVCVEYYEEIEKQGLSFELDIEDKPVIVQLDKNAFARAIGNLLTNALKYNRTGELIEITLEKLRDDNKVRVVVKDDGDLISSEEADKLFDTFTRGDKARRSDGGTGLGLSITKAITLKHGGNAFYINDGKYNNFITEWELPTK